MLKYTVDRAVFEAVPTLCFGIVAATLTDGTLSVWPARAGDTFVPFGSDTAEIPHTGEIVYVSGSAVRTRRFIWRQSECGKMTATTRALFPIDGFADTKDRIAAASPVWETHDL